MATTSAFGWETPDDTDLVKDGAAAIRTLGNSIDTSLAELKGGTTGQILSKTSATDMDFTWITNDQGDITGVTAGTGLTGGGTSGAVTVSLDIANYGGGQYATGKNKIINGDMSVWQRGTSFSNIFAAYTADRYISGYGSGGTQSISRQDVTGATGLPNDIRYAMRYATTSAASGQYNVTQRIENVQTLAGQTVVFSFYARRVSGTGTTLRLNAYQLFGTGGSTFTQPATDIDFTVTNSDFQRFTYSFTMPSMSGKTIGTDSYLDFRLAFPTAVSTFDVTGWQLEAGSTATPFQTASGSLQGELALCQRYYYRNTPGTAYGQQGTGFAYQTDRAAFAVTFPVSMRTVPSSIDYSGLAVDLFGVGQYTFTALSLTASTRTLTSCVLETSGSTGLTAFRPYNLAGANNSSNYLGFSAEL